MTGKGRLPVRDGRHQQTMDLTLVTEDSGQLWQNDMIEIATF